MNTSISRRQWMKTGALAASATLLGMPALRATTSRPINAEFLTMTDEERAFYYFQGQPGIKARLFANENPYGPSPKAIEAMSEALKGSFKYPFDERVLLQKKIADYEGVSEDHILLGAGSTQLLMAAGAAFGMNSGEIVVSHPTFDSLPRYAEGVGGKIVKVEIDENQNQDLDKMVAAVGSKTTLMYVVNPLNPVGTHVAGSKIKDFCNSVSSQVPVFVDEAYIDYHPEGLKASVVGLVREGKNVIVCKTFSKVHGFAGIRVGYCVAKPDLLAKLRPFSTAGFDLAQAAVAGAIASVSDTAFLNFSVSKTEESKQVLYKGLSDMGMKYIPSSTNFVMFPINMPGNTLVSRLKEKGVLVRTWEFKNQHWCRVSIGLKEEMEIFNQALRQVV